VKNRLLVSSAIACLLAGASAIPGRFAPQVDIGQRDRAAIAGVLATQQDAWNRGDVESFLQGYWRSAELTFSGAGGTARGWDRVLVRYKERYPDRAAMGQLEFSALEFRLLGSDAALVLGHWHLKRQKGDVGGVFSLVFERFPEGWRIIHDHTSEVPSDHTP
jgi:uncharacterized protein (TIGR02246 family)